MSMDVGSSNAYLVVPKHSWWSTQTTKEKKLIIICSVASVLALVFFICTIVVANRKPHDLNCVNVENKTADIPADKECSTMECRQTAFHMKINMKEDEDPCDNFYDFACGGFDLFRKEEESITSLAEKEFNSRLEGIKDSMLTETVKNTSNPAISVFKSCVNQGSEEKDVRGLIKEILGTDWPMAVGTDWDESSFNYNQSLAKLTKINCASSFLQFGVVRDIKDHTRYSVAMLAPTIPLPTVPNLKDIVCMLYPDCQSNLRLDEEIAELNTFNQPSLYSSVNTSNGTTDKNIPDIMKSAAAEVAELEWFTVQDLNQHVPQIDWNTFFQAIFDGTGFTMPPNFEVISLRNVEPLKNAVEKYTESNRLLANAIALSVVQTFGPLFSTQIEIKMNPGASRKDRCFNFLQTYLGFAFGKLYMEEYLPKAAIAELSGITHDLKAGFRKLVSRASWLDKDTQMKALEKVDNMMSIVASPEWVLNDTTFMEFYKKVTDVKGQSFILSSRAAVDNLVNHEIRKLVVALDRRNTWVNTTATKFNAFYNSAENSMYYPLGLLMSPFFSPGRSRAIKFGSFGYIAGHEITHGFDSRGKDYDKNGIVNNWWDAETAKKFENGSQCFVTQYSNIKDEKSELNLDGNKTLGENIADNGGLRAAYQAYKDAPEDSKSKLIGLETYTEDQLFFIAAAQTWCSKQSRESMKVTILKDIHSPHKYRGIVPFLNFPEFSKTFQCKEGSKMNPKIRCEIW